MAARGQQHREVESKVPYFHGHYDQTSTGQDRHTAAEKHVAVVLEPENEYVSPLKLLAKPLIKQMINVVTGHGDSVRPGPQSIG